MTRIRTVHRKFLGRGFNSRHLHHKLLLIVWLLFFPLIVFSQEFIEVRYRIDDQGRVRARGAWSPPTYGTPVDHYVLQHSINGASWYSYATTEDTSVVMSINFYDDHRIRVAGIDSLDRQGPFSLPSNTYCPADSFPQQPDQPIKE